MSRSDFETNKTALRNAIRRARRSGFAISIRCNEENDVILKATQKQTEREVIDAATCMDSALFRVWDLNAPKGEKLKGTALLVWDVGPGEVFADYTDNETMRQVTGD